MTKIAIIVAVDEDNAIGKNNQLLCHLPNDLRFFKNTTLEHTIIMGRKTFESLPNGALPNRRNIILSKQKDLSLNNCEVAFSLDEAISLCKNENLVFIIGGASVYKEAMPLADTLYITYIHHEFEGTDAFFPHIDTTIWEEQSRIYNPNDEKNKYSHSFVTYIRRQK